MAGLIPFNEPSIEGREIEYMSRAVQQGHTSCKGPFSRAVAEQLTTHHGAADALLTTSCTAALEMAALLLDIKPGDVVIVPSFTFVSTALAFVRAGARIRFADIERETLGIDPASVANLMSPEVRAVVPVHYAGVGCDLDGLSKVLAGSQATMVEDNAHGLFGTLDDRPLGSYGRFAALSFHETKNFVCGEGGALLINDPGDAQRAHVLCDKGTDRQSFLLGQIDKYSWVDTGSSFGLSDLLAAYLLGQLEAREQILSKRRMVTERYQELLAPHADRLGYELMALPPGRGSAYHMFYVLLDDGARRESVLSSMKDDGVMATFHYVPLHSAAAALRFADLETECPVTDDISARLVRLPFFNSLGWDRIEIVVRSFLKAVGRTALAQRQ